MTFRFCRRFRARRAAKPAPDLAVVPWERTSPRFLIQLSAAEIVRRAEACIGEAIRKGQAKGRIAKPGSIGGRRKTATAKRSICSRVTEVTGMRTDELTRGPYALTDGVSRKQFEKAIAEAKAEGNLSRANVVRNGHLAVLSRTIYMHHFSGPRVPEAQP
jgi:hypothetical protein